MNTFSERLRAALTYDGYITPSAMTRRLVEAFDIHPSTARRWLAGTSKPRVLGRKTWNGMEAMGMPAGWLLLGEWEWTHAITERQATIAGKGVQIVRVMAAMRKMTAWEQNKYLRLVIRFANNDPKVARLSAMHERGQISRRQLFEAM